MRRDAAFGLAVAPTADNNVWQRGRFVLILTSLKTNGHGAHTWAADWSDDFAVLLERSGPIS